MKTSVPTTREQHLAKVQLYRWYQLYEREMNVDRINLQMEILADDLYMKSSGGEMRGKENYPDRLKAYVGWKNAHHVENIMVTSSGKGLELEADIRYQNIRPDGINNSYTIHYNMVLTQNNDILPQFIFIEIAPTGETNDAFKDAYPTNRTKSLLYFWLANMETLDGDVTSFKELLADDFVLNFSSGGEIETINELEIWLKDISLELKESSHYPKIFSVKTIMKNEYEVSIEMVWKGVTKENQNIKEKTKHIWYIVDEPNNRFAKILKVDVIALEPFEINT